MAGIIETAENLLAELRTTVPPSDLDFQLMCDYVLLAKKNKPDAEMALNDFLEITSDEKYVRCTECTTLESCVTLGLKLVESRQATYFTKYEYYCVLFSRYMGHNAYALCIALLPIGDEICNYNWVVYPVRSSKKSWPL